MFKFSLSPVKPVRAYFVLIVASMALGYFLWKPIYIDATNEIVLLKKSFEQRAPVNQANEFANEWLHKAFNELITGKGGERAERLKLALGIKQDKPLIDVYINFPVDSAKFGGSSVVQVDATMLDVSKAKLPEMKVIFELEISEENSKFQVDNLLVKKIGQDRKYHQFISGLSASGPSDVIARNKRTMKLLRYADAWLDIDKKRFHDEYNRIIDFNPNCSYFYYVNGTVYLKEGNYLSSISNFNKCLELDSSNTFALVNRASAKDSCHDYVGSIYDLNQAIQINPKNFYAHINKGVHEAYCKNYLEEMNSYNVAIQLEPLNYIALLNRAKAFESLNQSTFAMRDYEYAIERYPQKFLAYYDRGLLHGKLKKFKESIIDLDNSLIRCPRDDSFKRDLVSIYSELSFSYSMLHDESRAFEYGQKEITLDPNNSSGYFDIAFSYWKWNQKKKAIACVEKGISLDPERFAAYNLLAKVKKSDNDLEGALKACDECLRRADFGSEIELDTIKLRASINKKLTETAGANRQVKSLRVN